jgi:hypothetical protein
MLENIIYIALGILALGFLIWTLKRAFTGIHGIPIPDSYDCSNPGTVTGHLNNPSSEQPVKYYAFVFDDPGASLPTSPDPGWEVTHTPGINFTLTGVPSDGSPPTGGVLVAIWAEYSDGDRKLGTAEFGCGSGSGNPELLARRNAPPVEQRVATTVAHRYLVPEPAFAPGVLQIFNREWNLIRRGGTCGQVIWDNGGNGTSAPLVELSTTGLYGFDWELTFRCGPIAVHYSIPGNEWQALAANLVRLVTASGVPADATLPPQLIVHPA